MTATRRRPIEAVYAGQTRCRFGGAEGIRTPDLLIANETRYQLRHSPKCEEKLPSAPSYSESSRPAARCSCR
jgi:hypothetical protein